MKIVIFGGTTEGRTLSHRLAARGFSPVVCVATEYGREEQGAPEGITVRTGRLEMAEMAAVLEGCALCVDATHPYAVAATENIRAACVAVGVPCRRVLRPESDETGAETVENAADAAARLGLRVGNILLTTGAKELAAYASLTPARLYPRVLPTAQSIAACEALGIPHRNILALQGPFSQALNEALIRQYDIRHLVTKDGGGAGGFGEKIAAARATGTAVLVIRRPTETGETMEAIMESCEEMRGCL